MGQSGGWQRPNVNPRRWPNPHPLVDPTLAWIIWAIRLISTSVVVSHFTPFLFLGLCGSHPYFIFKILLPKYLLVHHLLFHVSALMSFLSVFMSFFLFPFPWRHCMDYSWPSFKNIKLKFQFQVLHPQIPISISSTNNKRDSTVYIFHKISLHTLTYFLVLDLYWSVQNLEFDKKKM